MREWGEGGDQGAAASPQALALVASGPSLLLPNSGIVSTFAGSGSSAIADGVGTSASFADPIGIAIVPSSGNTFVSDAHSIRRITPFGVITTFAGGASGAFVDGEGTAARLWGPSGLAEIPGSGVLAVADSLNNRIRLLDTTTSMVTTLAGSGAGEGYANRGQFVDGTGTAASFNGPADVAVTLINGGFSVVVADFWNARVRLVTYPGGVTTTLASGISAMGVTVLPATGFVVALEYAPTTAALYLISPAGVVSLLAGGNPHDYADGAGAAASFSRPFNVLLIPSSGSLVVSDTYSNHLRLVSPIGVVTTIAGNGNGANTERGGYFADGAGTNAQFSFPRGLAITSNGALLVCDALNRRLRLVTLPPPAGTVRACDSTWRHVALTFSPSASPPTVSAFLDGALVFAVAATITLPIRSASTLRVGWSGDLSANGGSLFAGALSDLRIYSRALSAAEVAAFMVPPPCAPGTFSLGTVCTAWSTACPTAGTFYSAAGSAESDITCTPCASGTFQATAMVVSGGVKTACLGTWSTACPTAGTFYSAPGTASSDITCTACPTYSFQATPMPTSGGIKTACSGTWSS